MKGWIVAALAVALLPVSSLPAQAAAQGTAPDGTNPAAHAVKPSQVAKPPQGAPPPPRKPAQPAKPARPPKPGSREVGRPRSVEVSALGLWLTSSALGSRDATLTANQTGAEQTYTLFKASGELASSPGFAATVGYNLTRMLAVEGEFSYAPPAVRVTVSGDVENARSFSFDGENLAQYVAAGALVAHLRRLAFARGRGRTFVSAGAGYRREVHSGNLAIDSGQVYHAGGGVKYFLVPRARGLVRAFGFRAEARLLFGAGGFTFDGRTTRSLAARAGLIVAF